ncbi:structural maintenance of chromosomes protein 6A-like [Hibiscus syriacus]|uniref:structural maintenance of chromosomes protein 6A-like n=1 Tax=Hibiscus syriacus TaxID=106335 RepID=UPI0019212F02|nr:structural maintenance of chromosomes protein 6A-like [Hibiscus syriacus]
MVKENVVLLRGYEFQLLCLYVYNHELFLGFLRWRSKIRGAGTDRRVSLENFMCHSSLEIEFGEWVNFITGQNGRGKSAILTALCIAFGGETKRASKLKEFIKTGYNYAIVQVNIKNGGVDSFKPDIFGDTIIIERRITDSTSSIVLKDCQAFGGDEVLRLLREIERHQRAFTVPPIGPIGAHVFVVIVLQTLLNGDTWGPAVEQAIGKLLNALIVTNS